MKRLVESQLYIVTEDGETVERRILRQREKFAAVLGARPRVKISGQSPGS